MATLKANGKCLLSVIGICKNPKEYNPFKIEYRLMSSRKILEKRTYIGRAGTWKLFSRVKKDIELTNEFISSIRDVYEFRLVMRGFILNKEKSKGG